MRFMSRILFRPSIPQRLRLGFQEVQEDSAMSAVGHSEHWVERNWSWLVIAFGALLVIAIDMFAPTL